MKKLLPILLLLLGLGAGVGAGLALRPPFEDQPHDAPAGDGHGAGAQSDVHSADAGHDGPAQLHYSPRPENTETVRLPNQFVVPLITDGRVHAMVVIGLALEMTEGHDFSVSRDEPRLRAVLLQLLFDHANIGGFEGIFTTGETLLALRRSLREAARVEVGPEVYDVLITDLLRQES